MGYRITPITSREQLALAIDFRVSFLVDTKTVAASRLESDIGQNLGFPLGLVSYYDEQIVGVIFFVYQGEIDATEGARIINLSDFVVEEEHRGMLPFAMMKRAVKILNGCVITGFTPNTDMQKICSILKFRYQPVSWCFALPFGRGGLPGRCAIRSVVPNGSPGRVGEIEYLPRSAPDMDVYEMNLSSGAAMRLWGVSRRHERKILGVPIRLRCFWIWDVDGDGDGVIQKHASKIWWHMLLKRGIFLTVFAAPNLDRRRLSPRFPTIWMARGVKGEASEEIYRPFSSEVFL